MEDEKQRNTLVKKKQNLIITVCFIILGALVLSYLWFIINGFIPIGDGLEKSDWLTFCAGFLSFTGSVVLGAVAIWQSKLAQIQSIEATDVSKRMLALQEAEYVPIFTITEIADPQLWKGSVWRNIGDAASYQFFPIEDTGENEYIYYACFDLLFSNEGKYPICNFSIILELTSVDHFDKDSFSLVNNSIYVKANSNQKVRICLPTTIKVPPTIKQLPDIISEKSNVSIRISCKNAFNYKSDSELILTRQPQTGIKQEYRIIPQYCVDK